MHTVFEKIKSTIVSLVILVFPLFFLPFTQDWFMINKSYLLELSVIILIVLWLAELAFTKKLAFQSSPLYGLLMLFIISLALSVVISSPNKIQAILNPASGLGGFFALVVFTIFITQRRKIQPLRLLSFSSLLLSLITLIFFFQPLKSLPPNFNPMGHYLDLLVFLGFFVLYFLTQLMTKRPSHAKKLIRIWHYLFLALASVLVLVAFFSTLFLHSKFTLPPFSVSWLAGLETLKTPKTAFFGAGLDNFEAVFTQSKPSEYNNSDLWTVNFTQSRSFLLQLLTEAGLIGLLAFLLILAAAMKKSWPFSSKHPLFLFFLYLMSVFILLPISLPVLFIFFLALAELFQTPSPPSHSFRLNYSVWLTLLVGGTLAVIGSIYGLVRVYRAEYFLKSSFDTLAVNKINQSYEQMRSALRDNPFIERFHINFARLNLAIAEQIAVKTTSSTADKKAELSEQDRLTLTQAVQTAIAEAKTPVILNPYKTKNWENLAQIYSRIIRIAQGADAWTIAAYQKAIETDPVNPRLRFELGSLFYSLGKYDDALALFQQTTVLKNDWANGYYNLAWSAFQKKDYPLAVTAMEQTALLIDPATEDSAKVRRDLADFKKKLAEQEKPASPTTQLEPGQLTLPQTITPIPSPVILPETATPSANTP